LVFIASILKWKDGYLSNLSASVILLNCSNKPKPPILPILPILPIQTEEEKKTLVQGKLLVLLFGR
jgi:hypothetical protein